MSILEEIYLYYMMVDNFIKLSNIANKGDYCALLCCITWPLFFNELTLISCLFTTCIITVYIWAWCMWFSWSCQCVNTDALKNGYCYLQLNISYKCLYTALSPNALSALSANSFHILACSKAYAWCPVLLGFSTFALVSHSSSLNLKDRTVFPIWSLAVVTASLNLSTLAFALSQMTLFTERALC